MKRHHSTMRRIHSHKDCAIKKIAMLFVIAFLIFLASLQNPIIP